MSTMPEKQGFDIEHARHHLEYVSEYSTTGRYLEAAIVEIERLRAASIEYQNALDDVQNLKEQIETFHLRRENELRQMNEISWQNKTQATRIKELEDALAEYQRLGKIMEGRLPCLTLHGECARCSSRAKELCDAMHQIAEGKIGPKDAKPRSWQITDERIATISASLKVLERLKKVNTDTDHCYLDAGIAVLRTMLGDGNCLTAADAAALVGPHGKEHAKKLLKNEHEEVDW
jgi:DNA repair exonuclease SbcCD ATPase subunit